MRFGVLLLVFVAGLALHMRAFPPMEGSDEPLHYAYLEYLRAENRLPPRETYRDNCTRQQSGQPPLVYWLGARLLDVIRAPVVGCDAVHDYYFEETDNRWLVSPNPYRRDDNKTNFLPITAAAVPAPAGLPGSLRVARLVSAGFGVLAVLGAYLAAREVFEREVWRLTATAIFAFTPTFFHLSAYFTNDTAAAAFATLALWCALRIVKRGVTVRLALLAGLVLGLGGLAKVSTLLAAPAVGVALLLDWRGRIGRPLRYGLLVGLPLTLTFGAWMLYGWLTYSDPFGTSTHVLPSFNYDPPLGFMQTVRGMPDVYLTYVALLGYANVYMRPVTYAALMIVTIVALVGYVLTDRRDWRLVALLAVLWLATFIGFLRWYRTIFDVTGRLLMPAHFVYAAAITAGLAGWARRFLRAAPALRMATVGVFAVSGLVSTNIAINSAYTPRLIARDALPALQGPTVDFDDTVRLLGYTLQTEQIDHGTHRITLCWEVLQPTDRRAAYTVRYVRDGVAVANRTTVHNLGKYNSTQWAAGDIFCDRVDMPVGDPRFGAVSPEPETTYDILVFMLDMMTLDVNWQAETLDDVPVAFPVLGQVRS